MTTNYGTNVGAVVNSLQSTPLVSNAYNGGVDRVWRRDFITADLAQNDLISLGEFPSDLVINPVASFIQFTDLGTSITMDVGSAVTEDALVAAADVATAAGSVSVTASITVANKWKPLWGLLGLTADPGGTIELFAKLEGGNPASGSLAWQIVGQRY